MDYLFVLIIGLVIGSFLNVCIYRIPAEQSIAFPPSHCSSCNHRLGVLDLVPVLSYLFLRGRCRYCHQKISIQYPLIEILNAVLYVALYYKFGFTMNLLKYAIFVSLLIVIGMIDGKTKYVYKSTTLTAMAAGVVFTVIEAAVFKEKIMTYVIGAAVGFLIILVIVVLTKGMGEGDIEIALICGLFLGLKLLAVGLFLAFVIGGTAAVILVVRRKKGCKDEMAFGPSLAIGTIISLLFGAEVISWYMSFFV